MNRPAQSAGDTAPARPASFLGFDYGTERIGVAVGQSLTGTATPLETLAVRRGRPDWDRVRVLLDQWQPAALVVGTPLNMDGTPQPLGARADRFARQLAGRFGLPVHRADERLSSVEARQRLGRSRDLDAVAAQVILETWLSEHADDTA